MSLLAADPVSVAPLSTPERIAEVSLQLSRRMTRAIGEITTINNQSRILSLNAQVEASRGGESGAAFKVVAEEMRRLSGRTTEVAHRLETETSGFIGELEQLSQLLTTDFRGLRLSDLALANIDLIDRNLYERTCDIRWWATDADLVRAARECSEEAVAYAAARMSVILKAYTVYFDLVLTDPHGRILANGLRDRNLAGVECRGSRWFSQAAESSSGDEFGFESVHESQLVGGKRVLVYSCGVRENGDVNGRLIGVLAAIFNWDALAQTIVSNTPLADAERASTRVCICDDAGRVLADSRKSSLGDVLEIPNRARIFAEGKTFTVTTEGSRPCVVAHARSPGFETYATGWHSVILQELNAREVRS